MMEDNIATEMIVSQPRHDGEHCLAMEKHLLSARADQILVAWQGALVDRCTP